MIGLAHSEPGTPLFEARDIAKKFGEFAANQDVGLVIKPGEKHALLGENGAGKSTLVKMMYGVMQPTSGEFFWNGEKTVVRTRSSSFTPAFKASRMAGKKATARPVL